VNAALLLVGGGVAAYLLLRSRLADAATMVERLRQFDHPSILALPDPPPGTVPMPTPSGGIQPVHITAPGYPPAPLQELPHQPPLMAPLVGRWAWPVPKWQGRAPVISDGFGSPRGGMKHAGVDLMFGRIASDPFPVGTPNGTKAFVMPDHWMAVAASDALLWSAGKTERGYAVVLDHGTVATFYTHLESLLVPLAGAPTKGADPVPWRRIKAGQPLGIIGYDPQDFQRIKHLHFELWPGGPDKAVDPQPIMKSWQVLTPDDIAPFLSSQARNAANRSDLVRVRSYERAWPGTALHPQR
jgi:hypothetical protein